MQGDLVDRIERLLDAEVRPFLESHDGGVRVVGLEDGTLRIKLTGACAGCPAAELATGSFIEEQLRAAFPELGEVVLTSGVSESLLEQARKIMAAR